MIFVYVWISRCARDFRKNLIIEVYANEKGYVFAA
jgi:hypothetical protein